VSGINNNNSSKGYIMKALVAKAAMIIAAVLTLTSISLAKPNDTDKTKVKYDRAISMFESSLTSDIPGIVESTIYNVVLCDKFYPAGDYSKIENLLDKVARENDDPAIKYKAHLASMYLNGGTKIDVTPVSNTFDHEYLFRQIADQLEKKLLVSN
jgi:hypothetical protein